MIKKFTISSLKKCFLCSINMPNTKQNNEIEHINKETSLLQHRLKINEKSKNQFQNGLMEIGRMRVKQGQRTNLFETKRIQNIVKNIFQNKIKHIKNAESFTK